MGVLKKQKIDPAAQAALHHRFTDGPVEHDDLAHDLAIWVASGQGGGAPRMTWENIELPGCYGRPDVYSIVLTSNLTRLYPLVHEIKISEADFYADVRSGKWRKYLDIAAQVYFALPAGLAYLKRDLPPECGLMLRHRYGWMREKRAKITPRKLTDAQLLALIIRRRNPHVYEIGKARVRERQD